MAVVLGPGAILGAFEIISPLERGGMASLFLARRLEPLGRGELVALKVVRPHLSRDPGHVAMFIEEGRLGERLVHPHIVRTEALGLDHGIHHLAMEYVNGVSLAQLIAFLVESGRGLSPTLAVHVAICVARALHFAHGLRDDEGRLLDVVHRDVSPQNILLSHRGEVKLIDFGIAKARGRNWATAEGSLKGKLGYMSPEQARAEPLDRRTDVYALGVVLWEMLTHRRLFFGEPAQLLERLQRPNVLLPRSIIPTLPQPLEDVVMRALHPSREERYAGADELLAALDACHEEVGGKDFGVGPEAALAALVTLAVQRVRADEDLDPTAEDALRVSGPEGSSGDEALLQFTREIPRPALLAQSSPPTRVTMAPTPSAPARPSWRPLLIAASSLSLALGVLSVVVVLGVGAFLVLTQKEPEPRAAALAPPTPPPPSPPPMPPMLPSLGPVAPAEVAPAEVAELPPEPSVPGRSSGRRRRHREDHPSIASHLPSPANATSEPPDGPVRLPPGTGLAEPASPEVPRAGDHE